MLQFFFHTPLPTNKMEILVHNTVGNAPYIHPGHDSILELWRTFPNVSPLSSLWPKFASCGQ